MKITFKADRHSADSLILGLAKSGIPVTCTKEEDRMTKPGDIFITAEFPGVAEIIGGNDERMLCQL